LYSNYGMTSGKMAGGSDTSPTCGVICSGYLRGWNLKIVIHKNSHGVSHLASWFPTAIIDIKDVLSTFSSDGVDHWLSDVEPTPPKKKLFNIMSQENPSCPQLKLESGETQPVTCEHRRFD
jgi:hypothetical protein